MKKILLWKKYLPLLCIALISFIAWGFGLHHYLSFEALKIHQHSLDMFILQHRSVSLLIYIVLYVCVVTLSLPVAAFMTLAGGLCFGQMLGTVGAVVGATVGASLLFLSARRASPDQLSQKNGTWMQKMQKGFQENAFFYLLTLRLIPIFPFVGINLAAALLRIPFQTFFWGTLLGILPGSFVYVSLGVALKAVIQQPNFSPHIILDPHILIAFIGLGILSILPILYKNFRSKSVHRDP